LLSFFILFYFFRFFLILTRKTFFENKFDDPQRAGNKLKVQIYSFAGKYSAGLEICFAIEFLGAD
jgi:hypothetical protein